MGNTLTCWSTRLILQCLLIPRAHANILTDAQYHMWPNWGTTIPRDFLQLDQRTAISMETEGNQL